MMAGRILRVEVDDSIAERLDRFAAGRHVQVERLAAEALSLFVTLEDQPEQPIRWSAEDLAAIEEGFAQLDRGEGVSQDVVEREIADLLHS